MFRSAIVEQIAEAVLSVPQQVEHEFPYVAEPTLHVRSLTPLSAHLRELFLWITLHHSVHNALYRHLAHCNASSKSLHRNVRGANDRGATVRVSEQHCR